MNTFGGSTSGVACLTAIVLVQAASLGQLTLDAPGEVASQAGLPVVVSVSLNNGYDHLVRLARPDGYATLACRYEPKPAAMPGLMRWEQYPVRSPAPAETIELRARQSIEIPMVLDRPYRCGLLPGETTVVIRYTPRAGPPAWGLSANIGVEVLSNPVRLRIEGPADERGRAALAIYQSQYATAWQPMLASLWRRLEAGELTELAEPVGLAQALEAAANPAVAALWARLLPEEQEMVRRLAAGGPEPDTVRQLRDRLNEWIRDPELPVETLLAAHQPSVTTRAQLAARWPEADISVRNRAVLEDVLAGHVPPTLFRLVYEYADTPYAAVATYCLALRYERQPERALWWLDRLAAEHPNSGLEEDADLLRFRCLLNLGRRDEARAQAEALTFSREAAFAALGPAMPDD